MCLLHLSLNLFHIWWSKWANLVCFVQKSKQKTFTCIMRAWLKQINISTSRVLQIWKRLWLNTWSTPSPAMTRISSNLACPSSMSVLALVSRAFPWLFTTVASRLRYLILWKNVLPSLNPLWMSYNWRTVRPYMAVQRILVIKITVKASILLRAVQ